MKSKFTDLHDAFHATESKIIANPNRSMSQRYALDTTSLTPKKPQSPAQHASVEKAAQASVAKRRGLMKLQIKPIKSFVP